MHIIQPRQSTSNSRGVKPKQFSIQYHGWEEVLNPLLQFTVKMENLTKWKFRTLTELAENTDNDNFSI